MPIYEFYCPDCHKLFKFLSRRFDVEKRPGCPECSRPELERQVSLFAVSRKREEPGEGEELGPDMDETKLERAMEMLEREAGDLNEDDPRQAARLMRKLYDATGLSLGPAMEEAIRRMEGGEDPDAIEEELGDALESEDPFGEGGAGEGGKGVLKNVGALRKRLSPPAVDETLHEM